MFPLSGGIGGMAFDITDLESARETLEKNSKAHDDTLNHVADGVAIFGADRKLIFNNRAFQAMWDLDPSYLLDKPDHGSILDRLRERRKLPAKPDFGRWRRDELAYYQGEKVDFTEDLWNLPDGRILRVTRQRHPLGGVLLLFKDITDEVSLKAEFNRLINVQKATLDHLREAVVVFSADGRLRLHTDAFAELWELKGDGLNDGPDFDRPPARWTCKPWTGPRWPTTASRRRALCAPPTTAPSPGSPSPFPMAQRWSPSWTSPPHARWSRP